MEKWNCSADIMTYPFILTILSQLITQHCGPLRPDLYTIPPFPTAVSKVTAFI